jgi:hypothetical protein
MDGERTRGAVAGRQEAGRKEETGGEGRGRRGGGRGSGQGGEGRLRLKQAANYTRGRGQV